ncbi:MAG: ABC transporter permease [Tepidisphaeraceae bacterium]
MTKTMVVAIREYLSAVKTKGFVIGVILMPLLMGGGVIVQKFTQDIVDLRPKKCAVIDRTPDETLWPILEAAARKRNDAQLTDPATGRQIRPAFEFEHVDAPDDPKALDDLRLRLSNEIRQGKLLAMVEFGPDTLSPKRVQPSATQPLNKSDPYAALEAANDRESLIYYSSNRPTYTELKDFIQQAVQPRIVAARLNQSQTTIDAITQLAGTLVVPRGLASESASGQVSFEPRKNDLVLIALPPIIVAVMLVVVLVGASPLTTNIVEEKQLRIAEVLLGSVSPFELMFGKLLGGVATSLTLGVIYVGGAFGIAYHFGVLGLLSPGLIAWFIVFTIIASLMFGALFVVAGAAATNVKEAQALVTPMMLIVTLPLFLVGPLMNEPHGTVGLAGTFFPLSAPLVTMMRLATPPQIAWWQPVLAIISSCGMTIVLVWIAGRVFRAGLLLVGPPAAMRELLTWIIRG